MSDEEDKLTENQKKFCEYYGQLCDTYNNGTKSYALAYDHDLEGASRDDEEWDRHHNRLLKKSSYNRMSNMCAVEANRLLRKPKIIERIREIKSKHFDEDKIVDAKLMDIIQNGSYKEAVAAIKHRNELKQRVTKHVDLTSGGDPLKTALVEFVGEDDGTNGKNQSQNT